MLDEGGWGWGVWKHLSFFSVSVVIHIFHHSFLYSHSSLLQDLLSIFSHSLGDDVK